MIVYEAKTRSCIINGKNYSYIIYVNDAGYLQQLYYGAKLTVDDAEYLVRSFGKNATADDMNADMFTDSMAL